MLYTRGRFSKRSVVGSDAKCAMFTLFAGMFVVRSSQNINGSIIGRGSSRAPILAFWTKQCRRPHTTDSGCRHEVRKFFVLLGFSCRVVSCFLIEADALIRNIVTNCGGS